MKVHSLHLVFTGTFLILCEAYHNTTESCFHDGHNQNSTENITAVQHWQNGDGNHEKVDRLAEAVYEPLRITTMYSLENLLVDEQNALKKVMERAVRKMTRILSVIRKDDLLLLPRSACPFLYRDGINQGKCQEVKKGYTGEYCMDDFQIPSAHLEGILIYNTTHPDPVKIYAKSGPGLRNTDFVLYVTSQMTSLCNPFKTSAIAYAAYCKLDNSSRPVAGRVNFCPRTVKAQKFDEGLLYKAAVHELFHSLGFSNKLFEHFRNCNEIGVCKQWADTIVNPADRTLRLVTGAVVREMRKHFNCTSRPYFGGPLQVESGKATSHWDPILMHSSIMASREQKPYQTLIDPISLAVFEDTGWYKVNYSEADKFIWGQGQGCSFGLPGFCEEQEGFCLNNITGCHHLRLSKARCNFNVKSPLTCGVFATDQKPCFIAALNSTSSDMGIETFSSSSRCFFSSLTPTHLFSSEKNNTLDLTGRCLERRCEEDTYYVRVQGGDWLLCNPESHIQVEGFNGTLVCASYEVICSDFIHPEPPFDAVTSTPGNISDSSLHKAAQGSATSWEKTEMSFVFSDTASSAQLYFCPVCLLVGAVTSSLVLLFS